MRQLIPLGHPAFEDRSTFSAQLELIRLDLTFTSAAKANSRIPSYGDKPLVGESGL